MTGYRTIAGPSSAELIIKKSRFCGRLFPVESAAAAEEIVSGVRKEYWDATHNCVAMIVGCDRAYMRMSDDGEPQGTAGVPMLEVLKKSGLTNILAVVTRYFGGVLLGAGGLVRAYTESVAEALAAAEKVEYIPTSLFGMDVPYQLFGKMSAMLAEKDFTLKSADFAECVRASVNVPSGLEDTFEKAVAELSSGTVSPVLTGSEYLTKTL